MKTLSILSTVGLLLSLPIAAADEPAEIKAKEGSAKLSAGEKEGQRKYTVEYEGKIYSFDTGDSREQWRKEREKSLYHRIGGKASMDAAIKGFYKKVLADDRINDFFEDVDMKRQARKQHAFLSAAFGGPEPWKGKDLRTAHKNLDGLNDSHFNAVAENLQATLTELKLDQELIDEIMAIAGSVRDDVLNRKPAKAEDAKKDPTKDPTKDPKKRDEEK